MALKVVKLAVVPAALGLASFRVYATTEEKTDNQISPRDLSIYSAVAPAIRYVEEKPGRLQTNLGLMRARLQPYARAVQNTCTSVKVGAVSLYQAGQDTYDFLRDPPHGFLPRVGVIAVSGLAGLVLARKGSRLKRIAVPLALTAVGAAVCYPTHSVRVLKVTGKKVYAGSSLVASLFKSKPKEKGVVPEASSEDAEREVAPGMDAVAEVGPSTPEVSPVTDVAPELGGAAPSVTPGEVKTEANLAAEVTALPDVAAQQSSPVSEDSPAGLAEEPGTPPVVGEFPSAEAPPLVKDETTPHTPDGEETLPPSPNDVTSCPPVPEKPRFVADPSLQDHGQAHPEDADLYSTRG